MEETLTCRVCGIEKPMKKFRTKRAKRINFCHACYTRLRNQEKKRATDAEWKKRNPRALVDIRQRYGKRNDERGVIPEQKICASCHRSVSGDNFWRNRTMIDGLDAYCISCRKAYMESHR